MILELTLTLTLVFVLPLESDLPLYLTASGAHPRSLLPLAFQRPLPLSTFLQNHVMEYYS